MTAEERKGIGEGVQEAAMANINLPLAVILPRLYSELHIYFYEKYGILYAPLVFTMLMHLLVSEAVVHKLWPERDENGISKHNILYENGEQMERDQESKDQKIAADTNHVLKITLTTQTISPYFAFDYQHIQ